MPLEMRAVLVWEGWRIRRRRTCLGSQQTLLGLTLGTASCTRLALGLGRGSGETASKGTTVSPHRQHHHHHRYRQQQTQQQQQQHVLSTI